MLLGRVELLVARIRESAIRRSRDRFVSRKRGGINNWRVTMTKVRAFPSARMAQCEALAFRFAKRGAILNGAHAVNYRAPVTSTLVFTTFNKTGPHSTRRASVSNWLLPSRSSLIRSGDRKSGSRLVTLIRFLLRSCLMKRQSPERSRAFSENARVINRSSDR